MSLEAIRTITDTWMFKQSVYSSQSQARNPLDPLISKKGRNIGLYLSVTSGLTPYSVIVKSVIIFPFCNIYIAP